MTNADKYKTAQERVEAFYKFCNPNCMTADYDRCRRCCPLKKHENDKVDFPVCHFYWLDLEAEEEKPLPCPFCGKPAIVTTNFGGLSWVQCTNDCGYSSTHSNSEAEAIAIHNNVAKAVIECNCDKSERNMTCDECVNENCKINRK